MKTKTEIYTIRHAHTSYNADKRYAGSIDIPLNDTGIQSARDASVRLAGYHFDIVVTSTLRRTIQTAELLVGDAVPSVQQKLCNERNFGILEGKTWDEVQRLDPPVMMINVGNDLHTVNPKGGEPFENVWERAKKFRRYLFKHHQGSSILVVSHGVFLQMFHGVLKGSTCIESLAVYPSNLVLYKFVFQGNQLVETHVTNLTPGEGVHF
jgi:2,3-bisphosphoglycerate-dependent phosphoglycerate mutase